MILDRIVEAKKKEVEESKTIYPLSAVKEGLKNAPPARDFKKAVGGGKGAIIAEVKRKSPPRGRSGPISTPLQSLKSTRKAGPRRFRFSRMNPFSEGRRNS